jgi:hypothetical protein
MGLRGPKPGTNFKEGVAHEERHCDKHGRTMHREAITGDAYSKVWKCMGCDREDSKNRYNERKAGAPLTERTYAKPEKPVKTCPVHNLALPATGICDDC